MIGVISILAGAVGAVARYGLSGWVQARTRSDVPRGTLAVNLAGALMIGIVAGILDPNSVGGAAAFGFLGGFTTFSTWMVETLRMGLGSLTTRAISNLGIMLATGVALAAVGYIITN